MATKKVKLTGKYGSRYGVGIRRRLLEMEKRKKKKFSCPSCAGTKVKRSAKGIFECKKCGAQFSGGAYFPETLAGGIVKKMVAQKAFLPAMKTLIEATEKTKHLAKEDEGAGEAEDSQEEKAEKR